MEGRLTPTGSTCPNGGVLRTPPFGARAARAALALVLLVGASCGSGDGAVTSATTGPAGSATSAPEPSTAPADPTTTAATAGTATVAPGTAPSRQPTATQPTQVPPPSTAAGESGIIGRVLRRPCDPGDLRGCDAPPEPIAAEVVVTSATSGAQAARVRTTADAWYKAPVPAGSYRVTARTDEDGVTCATVDVQVPPGHYASADVDCI